MNKSNLPVPVLAEPPRHDTNAKSLRVAEARESTRIPPAKDNVGLDSRGGQNFPSEAVRFYYPDGTPCNTIIGKNGKERPPTIRDAKALDLRKSVTSVLKQVHKFGLERYKIDKAIEAGIKYGDFETAKAELDSELTVATDRGKLLHGAINRFIRGAIRAEDNVWMPHFVAVKRVLQLKGIDIYNGRTNVTFANEKYGGEADLVVIQDVIDFKTKDRLYYDGKLRKMTFPELSLQLTAYKRGLGLTGRRINVFVGADDQAVHIHEWPEDEEQKSWEAFAALSLYWDIVNG